MFKDTHQVYTLWKIIGIITIQLIIYHGDVLTFVEMLSSKYHGTIQFHFSEIICKFLN